MSAQIDTRRNHLVNINETIALLVANGMERAPYEGAFRKHKLHIQRGILVEHCRVLGIMPCYAVTN